MSKSPPLALRVQASLSVPPCRVGCRMRPERELAQTFGISRRKVREAIDHLVEEQILVREHGSGVYVRKIPPAAMQLVEVDPIRFDELFVADHEAEGRQRLQLSTRKRSLNFEVWWRSRFANQTAELFKNGLKDQAEALGHRIAFSELDSGREVQRVASQMLSAMGKHPCDGYIIHVPFVQACDLIDTLLPAPVIFVSIGKQPLKHQPMIRVDGTEMNERAIELLAEQGYRRIGMLSFRPDHAENDECAGQAYLRAMKELKLAFRRFERVSLNNKAEIQAALERLLLEKPACDAIYLSDDFLLHAALPMIEEMGYSPGRNLGMIVLSNRGIPLPEGYHWSRMEFDPYNTGRLTINSLVRSVESAGEELLSFSHHPAWRPGKTHLAPRSETDS